MSNISNDTSLPISQSSHVQTTPKIGGKPLSTSQDNKLGKLPGPNTPQKSDRSASTPVKSTEQSKPSTTLSFGGRSFGSSNQRINPELMQDHARKA